MSTVDQRKFEGLEPSEARRKFRTGELVRPTSGMCQGYVQANLAIIPVRFADDFEEICRLNEQALPLIERLPTGEFSPQACARGADLRTDLGGYMTYDGSSWSTADDLLAVWQDNFVAFVIGCSFSAERALTDAGVHLRHLELGGGVPIYRTNRKLRPAGSLTGHLVVSMRAIPDEQVEASVHVTREYPIAHGSPVLTGPGRDIGCRDGAEPDWGMELPLEPNETPVYWACGVTPQTIIEESNIVPAIVHLPGHMLITDIPEATITGVTPSDWRAHNGL